MAKDEEFDFMSEVMPGMGESNDPSPRFEQDESIDPASLTDKDLILSSYLLVNTLINLLVKKNYIHIDEVKSLVKELHEEFIRERRGL